MGFYIQTCDYLWPRAEPQKADIMRSEGYKVLKCTQESPVVGGGGRTSALFVF